MSELVLDEKDFLGDGTERLCYLHPYRKELCVKVCRPGVEAKQHRREKRFFEGLDPKSREKGHLVRYYGTVATDRGEGLVFETVRNGDGSVSKSLLHYLRNAPEEIDESMLEALKRLESFLLSQRIILKDPSPTNLLYRRDEEGRGEFVIIDGIGPSLPNMGPLNRLVEMKIARQWRKVIDRMRKETAGHPVLPEKINRYWRDTSK